MNPTRTLLSANLSGNGVPDLDADVVVCQEAQGDRLAAILRRYRGFNARQRGELVIAWNPATFTVRHTRHALLARSGRAFGLRNFGPTRYALAALGQLDGVDVAVVNVHLTNSPFNPHAPYPRLRRRLTRVELRRLRRFVRKLEQHGYAVIVAGDWNRRDDIAGHTGVSNVAEAATGDRHARLDRVFYDELHVEQLGQVELGQQLGRARVTHRSLRFSFRVREAGE